MTWQRLRESVVKDADHMLPSRVVLDYDESEGTFRTFVETFRSDGQVGFQYGRQFETEAEALEDFQKRATRL